MQSSIAHQICMTSKLNLERFIRQQQSISGDFLPMQLPRLKPFLTGKEGQIQYTVTGSETVDAAGRRARRLKCTILGWFLVADPETLEPQQYDLSIQSRLVLVNEESELPPLEDEPADEDYVTLGEEIDIQELIEEEILLDLPLWAIAVEKQGHAKKISGKKSKVNVRDESSNDDSSSSNPISDSSIKEKKASPFAKLAALKSAR